MTGGKWFRVRVGAREHRVELTLDGQGRERISVDGIDYEVAGAGAHAHRVNQLVGPGQAHERQLEISLASAPAGKGRPPTAAGRPPTAAGRPPTAAGRPPTAAGRPPTAAGRPPTAAGRPSEAWVSRVGARVQIEVLTEQEARLAAVLGKSPTGAGDGSIRAPMPGRVVKILVREGATIEAEAPAIIVEAMKMENELCAPITGVVTRIDVREGDTVDAGQVLGQITAPIPSQVPK